MSRQPHPEPAPAAVFVDPTGRRARLVRSAGLLAAAGAAVVLLAVGAAVSGVSVPPPWHWPAAVAGVDDRPLPSPTVRTRQPAVPAATPAPAVEPRAVAAAPPSSAAARGADAPHTTRTAASRPPDTPQPAAVVSPAVAAPAMAAAPPSPAAGSPAAEQPPAARPTERPSGTTSGRSATAPGQQRETAEQRAPRGSPPTRAARR